MYLYFLFDLERNTQYSRWNHDCITANFSIHKQTANSCQWRSYMGVFFQKQRIPFQASGSTECLSFVSKLSVTLSPATVEQVGVPPPHCREHVDGVGIRLLGHSARPTHLWICQYILPSAYCLLLLFYIYWLISMLIDWWLSVRGLHGSLLCRFPFK